MILNYGGIFSLIVLLVLLASCKEISSTDRNTLKNDISNSVDTNSIKTCNDLLIELVARSGYKNIYNEKLKVKIDHKDNNIVTIKVYRIDTTGVVDESAIGWLILDTKKATLADITYDIENPIKLHVDKKTYDQVLSQCFRIQVHENTPSTKITLNEYIESAPINNLPIVNNIDGFNQVYKGIRKANTFINFFSKISTNGDITIYRLPNINSKFSIIYETVDEAGQSHKFLVILTKNGTILSSIILYTHRELDSAEEGEYRDFVVGENFIINITDVYYKGDKKDIKKQIYTVTKDGIVIKN
jgi:hypothetical protein